MQGLLLIVGVIFIFGCWFIDKAAEAALGHATIVANPWLVLVPAVAFTVFCVMMIVKWVMD